MISPLFNHSTIPLLADVASFAEARHTVLAGNLTNINTPGYRTRDLSVESFQAALKKQIAADELGDVSSPGHPVSPREQASQEVKASLNNLVYHDGTNLDLEKQVAESAKNQFMHNLAISIMTNQFQLLGTAISERV